MSPEALTVDPSDSYIEEDKLTKFDDYVGDLLHSKSVAELPIEQQGPAIFDHFIGALVRRGEINTSNETLSAADVLSHLDSQVGTQDGFGLRAFTQNYGLRNAVKLLAEDERTGAIFGNVNRRIHREEDGSITFTTPSQLEGYLASGGRANHVDNARGGIEMEGDRWLGVMAEHAQRMIDPTKPDIKMANHQDARDMAKSDLPLIRNTGNDLAMMLNSADKVGLDMELVSRSAERIRERAKTEEDLGHTALFITLGNRAQAYRSDLDRRSGF